MAKIPTPISLSDIVRSTADELRCLKASDVANPVIVLDTCEIELTVTAEVAPGGKLNFIVWEAGVDAKYANAQKVLLKFKALEGIQAAAIEEGRADLPNRS